MVSPEDRAMRPLLATLAIVACLCGPVRAEDTVPAPDAAAIHGVITRQIEAFQRDDAPGAFGLATPSIQGMFGTASTFLDMVRRGYPPVYRPRSVDFAALGQVDGAVVQNVELIGPDGLAYTARYTMEKQPDGSWRISGCELQRSRRLGV
jgi:hypothetical protein